MMAMASKSTVEDRLRERDESRKAAIEQKRVEREAGQRREETADHYLGEFAKKKAAIVDLLESASGLPKGELAARFDDISAELQALKKFVSDSTLFLTAFDLKISQEQITQLLQDVGSKRDELLPKKKFAFKSRKKEDRSAVAPSKPAEENEQPRVPKPVTSVADEKMVGFRDRRNEKLSLNDKELLHQDVNLSGLESCEVRLCGPPSTLHMSKMNSCTVLSSPVSSSVFVEGCKDCVFIVACQQLRVHSTVNSQFYLHVTSRAIVEDCHGITFAPYSWTHPQLQEHFEVAGLNRDINNWDKVDDFNWLASKDPSPNWRVLPEDKRTTYE